VDTSGYYSYRKPIGTQTQEQVFVLGKLLAKTTSTGTWNLLWNHLQELYEDCFPGPRISKGHRGYTRARSTKPFGTLGAWRHLGNSRTRRRNKNLEENNISSILNRSSNFCSTNYCYPANRYAANKYIIQTSTVGNLLSLIGKCDH
jgi:hypothetical protein